MPSEPENPATLNPGDVQVDVQKVINSFTRQIAEQATKIAMLEARVETSEEEKLHLLLEIQGMKNVREATPTPQHNGRVTKPKAKTKKAGK